VTATSVRLPHRAILPELELCNDPQLTVFIVLKGGGGVWEFENFHFCYAHSRFLNHGVDINIEFDVHVTVHR